MPVLIIISSLGIGGTEQKVIRVANDLIKKGVKVNILSLSNNNSQSSKLDKKVKFNIIDTNSSILNRILAYKEISKHIHSIQSLNCIFFFNYYPVIFSSSMNIKQISFINTTHLVTPSCKIKKILANYKFKNIDEIIVGNRELKDIMTNNVTKNKLSVLHNGIDNNHGHIKSTYCTNGKFKIVIVARLRPEKKHTTLFQALKIIKNKNIDFSLDCFGEEVHDGFKIKLIQECSKNNISEHVNFLGNVDNVTSKVANYDAYVLPSNDTFSNATLEAMSTGCPVIASNTGGSLEMINDNIDGLLFEYNDPISLAEKIEILINSKTTRERLGVAAIKKINTKFSEELMFSKYHKYTEL
ncbi:glycosyltransferase [Aliivibrio kagoshimensis]|uniref:glycosyltransferase n=1 Tax=Aliivibrio kagoshimensis TaxID=2910230 RepID=UPI003D0B0C29